MSNAAVPDRLMWGESNIKENDVKYYNVKEDPFTVYGLYNYRNETQFKRLPDEIGKNVNTGVASLYTNTAGGRVRFSTDSDYVIIRAAMPKITKFDHMPLAGSAGFDLFEDDPVSHHSAYRGTFRGSVKMTDGYVSILKFESRKMRYLTVNFPLYSDVSSLEIGLRETASVGEGLKYRNTLPVIFYGSSITQGGCASRPGNCYQNMISRRLDLDYINLGFSGSGKAEDLIVNYMADLPMSVFVSDYDHNAPDRNYLAATHCKMYRAIRAKNPDVPYVMISKPDFLNHEESAIARRNVIMDTYRFALSEGDKNVYFIDGESFFKGEWEDCCTVDGCHPNDLGFRFMAESIGNTLAKLSIQ